MLRLDSQPVCSWIGWTCFQRLCKLGHFSWSSTRSGQPPAGQLLQTAVEGGGLYPGPGRTRLSTAPVRAKVPFPCSVPLLHCNILGIFVLLRPFSTPTFHLGGTRRGRPLSSTRFSLPLAFPATSLPYHQPRQSQTDVVLDKSGDRSGMTHKVDTKTRP